MIALVFDVTSPERIPPSPYETFCLTKSRFRDDIEATSEPLGTTAHHEGTTARAPHTHPLPPSYRALQEEVAAPMNPSPATTNPSPAASKHVFGKSSPTTDDLDETRYDPTDAPRARAPELHPVRRPRRTHARRPTPLAPSCTSVARVSTPHPQVRSFRRLATV